MMKPEETFQLKLSYKQVKVNEMKSVIVYCLLPFALMVLTCQCAVWDEDFVMEKTNYENSQLKLNGYYYHRRVYSNNTSIENWTEIYCFYANGVVYNSSYYNISIDDIEKKFKFGTYKSNKETWGLFTYQDTLKMEFVRNYSGLIGLSHTWLGLIINDSTLVTGSEIITNMDPDYYWELPLKNDTLRYYYFKPCDHLPNSRRFHY